MTTEQLEALAAVIAEEVPEMKLRSIIGLEIPGQCFDPALKRYEGPAEGRLRHGVFVLLTEYQACKVLGVLLGSIYEASFRLPGATRIQSLIGPHLGEVERKQALLAKRDFFFLADHLLDRLSEFTPQVCCIVGSYDRDGAKYSKQGTGFLVGPDLVLTAMHVFEPQNTLNPEEVPKQYRVFFDHKRGAPISSIETVPPGVRGVWLAPEWQVAGAQSFEKDGEISQPTSEQQADMKKHLDFALIRLSEPVGLEPVSAWGGRARAWIRLPNALSPQNLRHQERLLITQHPAGSPQCVDFGRLEGMCPSQTRIFYSVNTEKGSSGAPCFNRDFELVGMHNAEYRPAGTVQAAANQAIRFDTIQTHILPFIQDIDLPAPARLWNISSQSDVYRPIIGRSVLLKWIEDSTQAHASIRERTFAVSLEAGQGGKTFSWEVLEHCLKGNLTYVPIVFGEGKHSPPPTLRDLIRTLLIRLKVPEIELATMPSEEEGDGEKVNRWASLVVPRWFASLLETHRVKTIDRGDRARDMVQSALELNVAVSPEVERMAKNFKPQADHIDQWTFAWVVLDDVQAMTMNQDVQNFIAAIIQMSNSGSGQYQVLERLRWMFLGECPGFLEPSQVCIETLSAETYAHGLEALADDIASAAPYAEGESIRDATSIIKLTMKHLLKISPKPSANLRFMQDLASEVLTSKLPTWAIQ